MRDVLAAVPVSQREAALALGATKWETTRVVLANGGPGIAGAIILGLGRAIGETMAVTMLIGNRAADFGLALRAFVHHRLGPRQRVRRGDRTNLYLSALVQLGLILFLVTFLINGAARLLVWSVTRGTSGTARAYENSDDERGFHQSSPTRQRRGRAVNGVMTTLTAACAFVAVAVLVLILGYIAWRGIGSL